MLSVPSCSVHEITHVLFLATMFVLLQQNPSASKALAVSLSSRYCYGFSFIQSNDHSCQLKVLNYFDASNMKTKA